MTEPETFEVTGCDQCHNRFAPRPGPCPRCGSARLSPVHLSPMGTVLAATQLEVPPVGWPSPHRIALVELAESVRTLALVDGELPAIGATVRVRRDGQRVRAALTP